MLTGKIPAQLAKSLGCCIVCRLMEVAGCPICKPNPFFNIVIQLRTDAIHRSRSLETAGAINGLALLKTDQILSWYLPESHTSHLKSIHETFQGKRQLLELLTLNQQDFLGELQYSMLCNVYPLENTSGSHFLISVISEKMLKLISSLSKHMFALKGYL